MLQTYLVSIYMWIKKLYVCGDSKITLQIHHQWCRLLHCVFAVFGCWINYPCHHPHFLQKWQIPETCNHPYNARCNVLYLVMTQIFFLWMHILVEQCVMVMHLEWVMQPAHHKVRENVSKMFARPNFCCVILHRQLLSLNHYRLNDTLSYV